MSPPRRDTRSPYLLSVDKQQHLSCVLSLFRQSRANMSTTPTATASQGKPSLSQSRRPQSPPQRPTTPLRPLSRSSLRSSHNTPSHSNGHIQDNPIASLEPAFAEFSDSMADLEANFMHLQIMHESLARFSDCFASFLYGLNVNAWCVDFPEVRQPVLTHMYSHGI